MREIKFRGISKQTGKFAYGGLIRANTEKGNCLAIKDTIYNINNGKVNLIPEIIDPESIGQYTELKDKNGKEIYEGDILTPYVYRNWKKNNIFREEVIFKNSIFRFKVNKSFIDKISPLYESLKKGKRANNEYIIIGNIHENPELLEATK